MSDKELETKADGRTHRTRSAVVVMLVIMASLGVVVSLVGGWVRTTLFDTESFMEVVDPVLASDEVIVVLGDTVSDLVVTAVDVEGRLEVRLAAIDAYLSETLVEALNLPSATSALLARSDLPRLTDLADPIAAPIERAIGESIGGLIRSDGFQENLPDVVAFAHEGAVALVRGDADDLDNVSIVGGEVLWNITPTVEAAIGYVIEEGVLDGVLEPVQLPGSTYGDAEDDTRARLGAALGTVLPDEFGQVTVMSEESLGNWQSIALRLDRVAALAVVTTVVLAAAALGLSRDRRRTLVQLSAGIAIALFIAGIVQRNVLEALDDAIPGPPEQAAADVLFDAVFANLRVIAWVFMAAAVAVGLSAHIAGRPNWIKGLRSSDQDGLLDRLDAAMAAHRDAFAVGGVVVALAIWWWLGIDLASLLVVTAALGAYIWYLTRAVSDAEVSEAG